MVDFSTVTEFEKKIAEFFGAPFAVAVDSCTHGIELCLRYKKAKTIYSPRHTYISIPMLSKKLGISLEWVDERWTNLYAVYMNIIDAAVLWRESGYYPNTLMCVSFQYQKHLSVGRLGAILCDNEQAAIQLKKMSYDGRLPGIPWREQDIDTVGYHYYATPEACKTALDKLPEAIVTEPRKWTYQDYPDVSKMKVFSK
jgi:dTDP-4-amino-4,6-dideoxygalactose transaminase